MAKDKDKKNPVQGDDILRGLGGAFSGAADALFPREDAEPEPVQVEQRSIVPWVVGGAALLGAAYLATR